MSHWQLTVPTKLLGAGSGIRIRSPCGMTLERLSMYIASRTWALVGVCGLYAINNYCLTTSSAVPKAAAFITK